jgi:hypothetical protein
MEQRIPDVFHFVFGLKPQKKPFHLLHYLCLESCLQVNRPEAVYFYCHHEPYGPYWDRIKDNLRLVRVSGVALVSNFQYNDKAVQHYRYAHHSDFIRLEKLVERGGIYADMDTLFVNPLPRRLFDKPFVLGREQDVYSRQAGKALPSLCNALIMSPRASEFGRLWLDRMEGEFDGSWSSHSGFLPRRLSEEHPDWIHVEPPRSFYEAEPPLTVSLLTSQVFFQRLTPAKSPITSAISSSDLSVINLIALTAANRFSTLKRPNIDE